MLRIFFCFLIFSSSVYSNENLLTIQQQIERLQREVSDLSQIVFSNNGNNNTTSENDSNLATNLSAIDMRIYDIEKDLKKITANLEDVYFEIEDLVLKLNNFENILNLLEIKILQTNSVNNLDKDNLDSDSSMENTLGSLTINPAEDTNIKTDNQNLTTSNKGKTKIKLTPEEQFQSALDNIRSKNYEQARELFISFIETYPENQLSGSAHYWLGELYILNQQYRDAALVLAEGYQKFPQSIKAPDMLFKLSQSLFLVEKTSDSCKTLEKLIIDFPKSKIITKANQELQNYGCLEDNQ
tara:strand:- start:2025 stop:2918 length:894 start_codon:yes stop_codon:yes gene_type:complete